MKCRKRTCNNEALPGIKSCERCRQQSLKDHKVARAKSRDGLCSMSDCPNKADPGYKSCALCRAQRKQYQDSIRPTLRAKGSDYYQKVKKEVFDRYGGPKCACCGEEHMQFLSIDHLGDGAAHRKQIHGDPRNGRNFYYWLRKNGFPPGYQVLCMNCNFALGHHGYCPHHPEVQRECRVGRRRVVPTTSTVVYTPN